MKIATYILLAHLLIPNLCLAANAFVDGFTRSEESRANRMNAETMRQEAILRQRALEIERERINLEQQNMLIDVCKSVYKDNPEQIMTCVKDLVNNDSNR